MELWKNPKKFAAAFAQKTIEIQRCKAWRIEKTEETITITMITLCIGQHRTAQVKKAKKSLICKKVPHLWTGMTLRCLLHSGTK